MLNSVLFRWALVVLLTSFETFAAPVITDFSPAAGAPGDQVQISGSGFLSGSFVLQFWNGVTVTSGFINSDTVMTVVVPSGITTGPISIQQGTGAPFYTANDFIAVGYGPYITGFSPTFGSVNDTVVISGVHLTNTTAVKFGGVSASQFNPNAAGTQISTRVPFGATNGPITVSTIYGTSNSPSAFTVIGAGPYVTSFSPITGGTSTKVNINGFHFTGVTNVSFNGQPGLNLIANSDTLLQVQPPSNVLTGPITVSGSTGVFVTSSNFFGNPSVAKVTPNAGRAGTNVVVSGTNLLGASAVYFGSRASTSFTVQNNSNILATVPVGASTGLIRVVTPAGSAFSVTNFVVSPTLAGFSPAFGPVGTAVTLTGINLNASTPTVQFNGVTAAKLNSVTSTQVVAVVPAGATTGRISLSTTDGSDLSASPFFLPATVTGFSPTNTAPGSRISITGQNLLGTTAVSFNGTPATSFVVTNNSSMSAVVPANLLTGPLVITTPAGAVSSSAPFYGVPLIGGFSPTHGAPGTTVTVNGVNFLGGTLRIAGTPAALISLNNTQLVATVPNGAQTGPVRITAPGGSAISSNPFTTDYASDLSIYITNSANPILVGSDLVYTVGIVNRGPFAAKNASFTNTLPANAAIISAVVPPPWILSTNANILIGTATNYPNANSTTLLVTIRPQTSGELTASVTIGSDNPDPAPADNSASIVTTVDPGPLLSAGLLGDSVKISWPLVLTNYTVQFKPVLDTNSGWTTLNVAPAISGGFQFILQPNTNPARFYRLHH